MQGTTVHPREDMDMGPMTPAGPSASALTPVGHRGGPAAVGRTAAAPAAPRADARIAGVLYLAAAPLAGPVQPGGRWRRIHPRAVVVQQALQVIERLRRREEQPAVEAEDRQVVEFGLERDRAHDQQSDGDERQVSHE